MNKKLKITSYFLTATVLFFIDRLSKAWALTNLKSKNLSLFKYLDFSLSMNKGVSFGFFNFSNPLMFWLLTTLIAFIIILFIIYTILESKKGNTVIFEIFVISGALSNIVDRVLYKGVVDFIDFHIGSWHWPTFNLADVFIIVGVFGILGRLFYNDYFRKT